VEDVRQVLLRGANLASIGPHIAIVLTLAALTAMLAVFVFRWLETSARRTGMLGRF
jgi:hypothetical protein